MKVGENKYTIGCEISGCNNIAENRLIFDGELEHDIHICKSCLTRLYSELHTFLKKRKNEDKQTV